MVGRGERGGEFRPCPLTPLSNRPMSRPGVCPLRTLSRALVSEAHERFRSNRDGRVSDIYPALANVPQDQFGLCVVGVNGATYASGDWDIPFAIMSVSKPFVFALILQVLGADAARKRIGRQCDRPAVQLARRRSSAARMAERTQWSIPARSRRPASLPARRSRNNGGSFSMACRDSPAARSP